MEPLPSVCDTQLILTFPKAKLTGVVTNFIQQPLPDGSSTGAGFSGQSGALGQGQRAATGLNLCMSLSTVLLE
jgi:POT family proton-dependent oligopeptide transporter